MTYEFAYISRYSLIVATLLEVTEIDGKFTNLTHLLSISQRKDV